MDIETPLEPTRAAAAAEIAICRAACRLGWSKDTAHAARARGQMGGSTATTGTPPVTLRAHAPGLPSRTCTWRTDLATAAAPCPRPVKAAGRSGLRCLLVVGPKAGAVEKHPQVPIWTSASTASSTRTRTSVAGSGMRGIGCSGLRREGGARQLALRRPMKSDIGIYTSRGQERNQGDASRIAERGGARSRRSRRRRAARQRLVRQLVCTTSGVQAPSRAPESRGRSRRRPPAPITGSTPRLKPSTDWVKTYERSGRSARRDDVVINERKRKEQRR